MKMKQLRIFTVVGLLAVTTIIACKKGDTGPAGSRGAQGPAGNANVRVYHWGSKTTDAGNTFQFVGYLLPNEKYSQIDSIEWHFYVHNNDVGNWYPLPGLFTNAEDYFRVYGTNYDNIELYVERVPRLSKDSTKTDPITFDQATAVIIPAGSFTNLRTTINWNDYNDVKAKLHLKEEDEIEVK